MSDTPAESKKAVDPLEPWRELRDAYIDVWAKATGEAVKSEAYAEASGAMLETVLSASSPFREAQKKLMVSALEQLNMPSRADFVSLAERLANLELLLDDMDAKLTQIHQLAISVVSQPAPKADTKPTQSAIDVASQASLENEPETKSDLAASIGATQPAQTVEPEVKPAASRKPSKAKKGSR